MKAYDSLLAGWSIANEIYGGKLFSSFGITITDAINILLRKSIMEGGLPFEMKQPHYNVRAEAAYRSFRSWCHQ